MAIFGAFTADDYAGMGRDMSGGYIEITRDRCKGCRLCMEACKQGSIVVDEGEINALGYMPVKFTDPENKCKGCKLCAESCPDSCILVFRAKKDGNASDA